jgi:hypothetical protein
MLSTMRTTTDHYYALSLGAVSTPESLPEAVRNRAFLLCRSGLDPNPASYASVDERVPSPRLPHGHTRIELDEADFRAVRSTHRQDRDQAGRHDHLLPKLNVAGSNPVSRSIFPS